MGYGFADAAWLSNGDCTCYRFVQSLARFPRTQRKSWIKALTCGLEPELWYADPIMSQPLTANDLLPLVARLTPRERERLAHLISARSERDAAIYATSPVRQLEFASNDESLAWDAEGWEDVK